MASVLDHALAYLDAGFSLLPIKQGGEKRPAVGEWKPLMAAPPTKEQLDRWLASGRFGIALVCGAVSGGVEVIDFDREAEALYARWRELIAADWPELLARVAVVRTPRPGFHVWLRCGEIETPGNQKLAQLSEEEWAAEKAAAQAEGRKAERTLIETRGEGGYALVPGCPAGCHETGRCYAHLEGCALEALPPLSIDERDFLLDCARLLNRDVAAPEPTPRSAPGADLRPGDHFDRDGWDWGEILTGWTLAGGSPGGERRWRRPGKSRGWSATTGVCHSGGADLLRVFSSNAEPFEEGRSYGKFRAFALLHEGGDLSKAAKALRHHGFGTPAFIPRKPKAALEAPQHSDQQPPPALPKCYSHDELLDAKFPPQTWLLDSLVPSGGLVILGGKKKLGKSWLCLQLVQAIAGGVSTLGRPAIQGAAAYVCLEDGERRLQDRLMKQRSPRGLPIRWFTQFTKLDDGGLAQLAALLGTGPRLVVIDTLAAAKTGKVDENSSGPMGDIGNALRGLAQDYRCAIVVTHHHGKFSYGDPGDDLRGSSALAAAADLNLGLYRVEDGYRLRGEGRDIEAFDYAVTFDAHDTWQWKLIGDARVTVKEEADAAVLFVLANVGEAEAAAIASATGKSEQKTRERLKALVECGKVQMRVGASSGRGRPPTLYRLPPADAGFGPCKDDGYTPFDDD